MLLRSPRTPASPKCAPTAPCVPNGGGTGGIIRRDICPGSVGAICAHGVMARLRLPAAFGTAAPRPPQPKNKGKAGPGLRVLHQHPCLLPGMKYCSLAAERKSTSAPLSARHGAEGCGRGGRGRLSPEQRNFLLLICPMRLLARRRGLAQRAPLVSIGLARRKSASHFRLQSQTKGFWARCLRRGQRVTSSHLLVAPAATTKGPRCSIPPGCRPAAPRALTGSGWPAGR